ncbi:MAG: hypothetical protein ACUVTZ_14370 [Armatimonadota bacterium]
MAGSGTRGMRRNVYLDRAASLIRRIRTAEARSIACAARMIADAVAAGRKCYYCDIGHMLPAETAPARRGRPTFVVPLAYRLDEVDRLAEGDVLVLGSVLGVFALLVDMADKARSRGAKVVYIGSPQPKGLVPPQHPNRRRASDAADVVVNTHVPFTDGCVEVAGRSTPACPLSGIANTAVFWSLMAEATELLLKRGCTVEVT